jgi:hypothetical protein
MSLHPVLAWKLSAVLEQVDSRERVYCIVPAVRRGRCATASSVVVPPL